MSSPAPDDVARDKPVKSETEHHAAMAPERRAAVEKSMKRKLDTRCSLFVLIYIMNYLDRNNIAAARLKGLERDLSLDYNQYATCLSILYAGYILMTLGHAAWRWLFWIEGGVTMAIAISSAFILPDLPHNTKGFTDEELYVAQLRMTEDVGEADLDSSEQGVFDGLVMTLKDFKVYLLCLVLTAYVIGLSFNAYFPTLTGTLGFGYVPTLLLSSPPWAFSCVVSLFNAWHSDRTQEKFWHIVGPIFFGIIGFVISMSTLNVAARYVALFLQASSYAGFIVFYSWISSSFPRPPAKRAVALALVNAFSQLGNIAGSYVWNLSADGFRGSYAVVLAMFGLTVLGCLAFRTILVRANRRLADGQAAWETRADVAEKTAATTEDVRIERLRKEFRYLV
ncbi:hypothetical protein RB595_007333 [Gaeumannomyces hyphopodioides]